MAIRWGKAEMLPHTAARSLSCSLSPKDFQAGIKDPWLHHRKNFRTSQYEAGLEFIKQASWEQSKVTHLALQKSDLTAIVSYAGILDSNLVKGFNQIPCPHHFPCLSILPHNCSHKLLKILILGITPSLLLVQEAKGHGDAACGVQSQIETY